MKINISNLKKDIVEYNKLLEEYEENYLNYYNVISSFSFYWKDSHSKFFFINAKKSYSDFKCTLNELKEIKSVYQFVIDKYSSLGNKIEVNFNNKKDVINKLNDYISKINDIISKFNNLDLSFCTESEKRSIFNQKSKVIKVKNDMNVCKNKIENIYTKIEGIENKVNAKIKNINVSIVEEPNISNMF